MKKAIAFVQDTANRPKGSIIFEQIDRQRVKVYFELKNFEPSTIHAIHIHEYGDLSRGCESLGSHYNPTDSVHGSFSSRHRHKGDLINNFETNARGDFLFMYIDNLNIPDLYGRSVVIHQYPDDLGTLVYDDFSTHEIAQLSHQRGYPILSRRDMLKNLKKQSLISGNAGPRIACGIIGRMKG